MGAVSTFKCTSCGKRHAGPPLAYDVPAPVYWVGAKYAARDDSHLDDETCIIEGKHFFIKGSIELPIRGAKGTFVWTVWVSLSQANFDRARTLWSIPGREAEPPYFGWLSSELPYAPSTVNLKTMVRTRPVGERPSVQLEPTKHPLAVEQRRGIARGRILKLASQACGERPPFLGKERKYASRPGRGVRGA